MSQAACLPISVETSLSFLVRTRLPRSDRPTSQSRKQSQTRGSLPQAPNGGVLLQEPLRLSLHPSCQRRTLHEAICQSTAEPDVVKGDERTAFRLYASRSNRVGSAYQQQPSARRALVSHAISLIDTRSFLPASDVPAQQTTGQDHHHPNAGV